MTGIDHVAIACSDTRKLADWYCRNLDMKIIQSNQQDPPAFLVGYDQPGSMMIELMPARDTGPAPIESPRFSPGMRHLAIRVTDFSAACDRLLRAGIKFLFPPGQALGGGQVVGFRDPEGNELQIVARQ